MNTIVIDLKGSYFTPFYVCEFSDFGDAISFLCDLLKLGRFNHIKGKYSLRCWNTRVTPKRIIKIYYADELTTELVDAFLDCEYLTRPALKL